MADRRDRDMLREQYADGSLDAAERVRLLSHLQDRRAVARLLQEIRDIQVVDSLLRIGDGEGRSAVDAQIQVVMEHFDAVRGPRTRASRLVRLGTAALAAAAALLAAFLLLGTDADARVHRTVVIASDVAAVPAGTVVPDDASVTLAADQRLVLVLDGGSRIDLEGPVSLRLGALGATAVARLDAGSARVQVARRRDGSPFVLATPHGTVTALGTRFTVVVDTEGASVSVDEGRVALTNKHGRIEVVAGSSAGMGADAPPRAHAGGAAPPRADLRAWWPLDRVVAGQASDASGNGHDLRIMGDPQLAAGVVDAALAFHPGRTWGVFDDARRLGLGDAFTVACWVRIDDFANAGRIATQAGTTASGWSLHVTEGGAVAFSVGGADVQARCSRGTWTHVAASYAAGGAMRLYLDGRLADERLHAPHLRQPDDRRLCIGAFALPEGGRFGAIRLPLQGAVDELRLYAGNLSTDQVAALAHR